METDYTDLDNRVFSALNEHYENTMRTVKIRGISNRDDDHRHYSFDCWDTNGDKYGIHAYYSFSADEIVEIYESAGENFSMSETE
ncbi:hypothetical protein [Paenibacillus spongiae]|uniref:Uncharacterized protein n=1 Tax=Paenibacillus spongiae TaxID=2909671 RepID=A0ABY5SCF4_9BACL|nr:hypothetical protein [Paenibacillus spongiae]UVI31205.1 hypothetical protein L1F29_05005 [Paenibacillus spongiae]